MILYDFYCSKCHHGFEAFAKIKQTRVECPQCGGPAGRCVSLPRIKLDGTDPAFSTAYDQWARVHEQAAKVAYKRDDIGGDHHGDN